MQYASTLEPVALIVSSFSSSEDDASDIRAQETLTAGSIPEDEPASGLLRSLRAGLGRMTALLRGGLSKVHDRLDNRVARGELKVAIAVGRRQVSEQRRLARLETREARAELAREEREYRAARRRSARASREDELAEARASRLEDDARDARSHASQSIGLDDDGGLGLGYLVGRGQATIRGLGPAFDAPAAWMSVDERPERGLARMCSRARVA